MDKKGNEFKGIAGFAGYKRGAVIMVFTENILWQSRWRRYSG